MISNQPLLDPPLLIKCNCHAFELVEFGWFEDEPKIFYLTITYYPKGIFQKLQAIWKIMKGSSYGITDEVLINHKEAKKLVLWLGKRVLTKHI